MHHKNKILLTGSTSFLGRCLVPILEKYGFELYHLSRRRKGFNREYLWDFSSPLPYNLPLCDITVHLAAFVGFSDNLLLDQYIVNVLSTVALAKHCTQNDSLLILASMAGVHGTAGIISKNSPLAPYNHYSMSKILAEKIGTFCHENMLVLRLSGIYGIDGPDHLMLNKAIRQAALEGVAPVLFGTGHAKRNYICVEDAARWIYEIIRKKTVPNDKSTMKAENKIIYISGNEIMSIENYLNTIMDVFFPGKFLKKKPGIEAHDYIVESSPTPFDLTSFHEYLKSIHRKMQKV